MDSGSGTHEAQQAPLRGTATARLSLCAVGLMWTLPFVEPRHYYPLPAFVGEWLAFVLGLAALTLLAGRRAWAHGRTPLMVCAPLALGALILVQAAAGQVPYGGQAVAAVFYLVWCAALVALGAELKRRLGLPAIAAVLAWFLVCGGLLSAAAGILQHYDLHAAYAPYVLPPITGVYGNLAQRNHYADYLCLAIASSAYLYASGRLRQWVAVLVTGTLVFGLGASASRGAWLYLAMALLLAAHYRRRDPKPASTRLLRFMIVVVFAFTADQLLMTAYTARETAVDRFLSGSGFEARLQIARSAAAMFLQAPLFGSGWGSFAWFDFEFRSALAAPVQLGVTQNAHNLPLHLLAETGLAGGCIVIAAALLWLRDAWQSPRSAEWSWLAMLVGTIGVHSMLEFPLWHSYFLGVAAVALGLGAARHAIWPLRRVAPMGCAAILIAGAANAAALAGEYRAFERLYASGQRSPGASLEPLAGLAERDIVLQPYVELEMSNRMEVNDRFVAEKLAMNASVMRFFPAPMVVFRHAVLLALGGEPQPAAALFARAARVYPGALPEVVRSLERLRAAYPLQIAPLLELASSKIPSPAVTAP